MPKARILSIWESAIPINPLPCPSSKRSTRRRTFPIPIATTNSPSGQPEFLQSAARWYKRETGQTLDPESEILLLIGSKEGLAHVAWAYLDPGDLAIVPNPAYTVYRVNSLMAGAEVYEMPLVAENGFLPDLDAIPASVADRAKLLFFNYPNNPTGAVATREFYQKAVEFAHKHNVLLINDCAYFTVTYDGFKHPSLLELPGAREVTLEFHSLSKMYNMTGWRSGFAIGNKDAVATLNKLKSNIDSKQFPAVDLAAAYALDHVSNQATFDLYTLRRNILIEGLQRIGFDIRKPKATFYVWLKNPKGMSSMEFAKVLLEQECAGYPRCWLRHTGRRLRPHEPNGFGR